MTQATAISRTNRFGIHTVAISFPSGQELTVWDQSNERIASVVKVAIGYYRDRRTGNFIVTWADDPDNPSRQQISVLPGAFHRVLPYLGRNPIADLIFINAAELIALGFVIPSVDSPVTAVC